MTDVFISYARQESATAAAVADSLRAAGHTVHTPDLFDGRTFQSIPEGLAYVGTIGFDEMRERGVHVMAAGLATVAEEMPEAYKDVADVVNVVHGAGVAVKVAQLRPIGVIKG